MKASCKTTVRAAYQTVRSVTTPNGEHRKGA
jgi:hypothetical protein